MRLEFGQLTEIFFFFVELAIVRGRSFSQFDFSFRFFSIRLKTRGDDRIDLILDQIFLLDFLFRWNDRRNHWYRNFLRFRLRLRLRRWFVLGEILLFRFGRTQFGRLRRSTRTTTIRREESPLSPYDWKYSCNCVRLFFNDFAVW